MLFVIATMPLNHILNKCTCGYKLTIAQETINLLIYMYDIKLFVIKKKEWETLIQTVRIQNQDSGTEFGFEKCTVQITKSGKRHMTEGMELLNQENIGMLGEKETNKYSEI